MGILGDDDGLLGSNTYGSEPNYSSQLGRISGKLLTANLQRNGIDIAVETDLLYLDVTNKRVSIKKSPPAYDLDVDGDIHSHNLTVDTQLIAGNLKINNGNTFTTSVGGIQVMIAGSDIFHDRLTTSSLIFNDNQISSISNSNIVFDPNGTGKVNFIADTNITGNLTVTGNITLQGDLTGIGTLTIGDQTTDTASINTDFTQTIVLGNNEVYDLGKPTKRWDKVYQSDWTSIGNSGLGIHTSYAYISDQVEINGVTTTITTTQSNEDLIITADSADTYLEKIAFNENAIINPENNPLLLQSTGIGYIQFTGTNGMVVPNGSDSERPLSPEVGETRYNTERGYLECFDGTVWSVATGGGIEVTQELMYDIGNIWTLVLG